jgi:ATP-binding cassette subfamily B protein
MRPPSSEPAALTALAWPPALAGEALAALARVTAGRRAPALHLKAAEPGCKGLGERLATLAARLGLEVEAVASSYGQVEQTLRACAPALLALPGADGERLLAVTHGGGGRLQVIGPDLRTGRIAVSEVAQALCRTTEEAAASAIDGMLSRVGLAPRRRARARSLLLRDRLAQAGGLEIGWLLRLAPGESFWRQCRQARLDRTFFAFVGAYTLSYSLLLASWWALGVGVLAGHLVPDALAAWALILLSLVPFRMVSVRSRSRLVIGVGALFRRRLLAGALRLRPDEIRRRGAGQLLGRVIESEAVETLGFTGGFLSMAGLVEVTLAIAVLAAGASPGRAAPLLGAWLLLTLALSWRMLRARRRWTDCRLDMTHALIEQMVGYRTRLVQEERERRHVADDAHLETYLATSRGFDRSRAILLALVPRGWLLAGLAVLAPDLVSGSSSPAALAISLGGILAAYRGLAKCAEGFVHLSGAILSWREAAELFRAAARESGHPAVLAPAAPTPQRWCQDQVLPGPTPARLSGAVAEVDPRADEPAALAAFDLVYRHEDRALPVLDGCTVNIASGDRLLVTGPSGSGKSTLAAVLAGLREPASGLVLLGGLDRPTVGGEDWRRRVALAPQFHENHVFTETLAFNLLMGRRWPPSPGDLVAAEEICRALGLGNLFANMPSGMQQMLGESGWQLSHGERSRLFLARALLQDAEVVILDESLAALDPGNFLQCLDCAVERAPTLLLIAHP